MTALKSWPTISTLSADTRLLHLLDKSNDFSCLSCRPFLNCHCQPQTCHLFSFQKQNGRATKIFYNIKIVFSSCSFSGLFFLTFRQKLRMSHCCLKYIKTKAKKQKQKNIFIYQTRGSERNHRFLPLLLPTCSEVLEKGGQLNTVIFVTETALYTTEFCPFYRLFYAEHMHLKASNFSVCPCNQRGWKERQDRRTLDISFSLFQ